MKLSCSCKGRKYFAYLYVPEFTGGRIGLNFRKLLTKGLQISDSLHYTLQGVSWGYRCSHKFVVVELLIYFRKLIDFPHVGVKE